VQDVLSFLILPSICKKSSKVRLPEVGSQPEYILFPAPIPPLTPQCRGGELTPSIFLDPTVRVGSEFGRRRNIEKLAAGIHLFLCMPAAFRSPDSPPPAPPPHPSPTAF